MRSQGETGPCQIRETLGKLQIQDTSEDATFWNFDPSFPRVQSYSKEKQDIGFFLLFCFYIGTAYQKTHTLSHHKDGFPREDKMPVQLGRAS